MTDPTHSFYKARVGRHYAIPLPAGPDLEVPSVTTILKVIDKPALVGWAKKVTAEYAINNLDRMAEMVEADGTQTAIDFVKKEAGRRTTKAADAGTAVHHIADRLILGEDISTISVDPAILKWVNVFLKYVEETGVQFTASEMTVFDPDVGYAGTLDALTATHVIDWKTRQGKSYKRMAAYETERMQLAAYARAPYILGPDGKIYEKPVVDHATVVMLCDDGYALTEVDVAFEYEGFLAARRLWEHLKGER